MSKQGISELRREFKINSAAIQMNEIYNVYLKKDNKAIIHQKLDYFERLGSEEQELYFKNFKKVLSGVSDKVLFQLDFLPVQGEYEDTMQGMLYKSIKEDKLIFKEECDKIVDKISQNYKYDNDIVITFVRFEYLKSVQNLEDTMNAFKFILCSINKVDIPKKVMQFDFLNKEFKASSSIEMTINLDSPLDGFMFPSFMNNYMNLNKLVYHTSKPKEINEDFIKNVLNCHMVKTAEEEKEEFTAILKGVVGEKVSPNVIQNVYEKLSQKVEQQDDEEEVTVTNREVKNVLEESGVEGAEKLENVYEDVLGDTEYDFKVKNIIPKMSSKSIKISNEDMSLSITPNQLKNVKKIRDKEGKTCLLIKLNEDITIEGFELEIEDL